MNYEALVPSRELCQRMAELNICQDGAELWFVPYPCKCGDTKWIVRSAPCRPPNTCQIIAPTLHRMMEALPLETEIFRCPDENDETNVWFVDGWPSIHLPNAVAKALIAIKDSGGKGGVGGR